MRLGGWRCLPAAILLSGLLAGCGGGSSGGGGAAPQGQPAAPPGQTPPPGPGSGGFDVSLLGWVSKTYQAELPSCVTAVKASLEQVGIHITDESKSPFRTSLSAEAADGTALWAEVTETSRTTTRVSIKVGYFLGDRDVATRVHSQVESELSAKARQDDERRKRWGGGVQTGTAPPATTSTVPR